MLADVIADVVDVVVVSCRFLAGFAWHVFRDPLRALHAGGGTPAPTTEDNMPRRRFALAAPAAPRYTATAPQILAVANKGGKHLHRAARINGKTTLTACGEVVTGRYGADHEARIIAAVGGSSTVDAVTCRHCACMTAAESDRRRAAWHVVGQ